MRTHAEFEPARRTALLLVDLQNCFVAGGPLTPTGALPLLLRLNELAATVRAAGGLIVHSAHVLRPGRANAGRLLELAPVRDGLLDAGAGSSALHPQLYVGVDDVVLAKPRFGAFHGTDLELVLRTRGIEHVIVGGIATNVCCLATAHEAAARDFRLTFLADGTATFDLAGVSAADHQRATCAAMTLLGDVRTVEDLQGDLRAADAA